MEPRIDISGNQYGKLTVLDKYERVVSKSNQSDYKWLCRCECGTEKYIRGSNLRAGNSTSCGCNERAPGLSRAYVGYPTWVSFVWQECKANARERSYKLTLTIDQVMELCSKTCYYCGSPPRLRPTKIVYGGVTANGIDRKDSSIGYVPENCVPCCSTCNVMKMALHHDEFLEHIKKIHGYHF